METKPRKKREGTHNMSNTRFYRVWDGIRQRCGNANDDHFYLYGGRGVVCEWNTFISFRDDMFKSYQIHADKFGEKNTTIDRKDNNGNYCKVNCQWKTKQQQYSNKRNNRYFTFKGKVVRIADLMLVSGLGYKTIQCRIDAGWPIEKVVGPLYSHYSRKY